MVRRLCDRRAGLGGDGVLRVVRSVHVPDAPAVLGEALDRCEWFMDHRNADGSHAEMCGNGIRLFLHVLVTEGLLDRSHLRGRRPGRHPWRPAPRRRHPRRRLLGRHGPGPAVRRGEGPALGPGLPGPRGVDGQSAPGLPDRRRRRQPRPRRRHPRSIATLFPEGVNVELINVLEPGTHIRLRVYERGRGGDPVLRDRRLRGRLRGAGGERPGRGDRRRRRPRRPPVGAGRPRDDGPHRPGRDRLGRRALRGVARRLRPARVRSGRPSSVGASGLLLRSGVALRLAAAAVLVGTAAEQVARRVEPLGVPARVVDLLGRLLRLLDPDSLMRPPRRASASVRTYPRSRDALGPAMRCTR